MGKRPGLLSRANPQWCWCSLTELSILCNEKLYCFLELVKLSSGNSHSLYGLLSLLMKRSNCHTKSDFSKKRMPFEWVLSYWSYLKTGSAHRAFGCVPAIHQDYNRTLGWNKAGVALWRKPLLGLLFLHWVQYTLQVGSFKHLVVWSWCDGHQAIIALPHYVLHFSPHEKNAFSYQIRLHHNTECVFSGF